MVKTFVAKALPISLCSTVLAINTCLIGLVTVKVVPLINTYANVCQTVTYPERTRSANPNANIAIKDCKDITNFLRSSLSPSTPPQGVNIRPGKVFKPPMVTTKNADAAKPSVKSRTSQPTVNSCIH